MLFSFTLVCYSAPCYGTRLALKKGFIAGLQNYSVFKRHLKEGFGTLASRQSFFLLSYGLSDWLSIDLKGGTGSLKQRPLSGDLRDYPFFLGGGYGLRLRLYEKDKIKTVFGFQHISIHPKTIHLENAKHKAVLDDWQFSLLTSYDFKRITPYLGMRWSRFDYIHWVDNTRQRVKSDLGKSVGLITGFDLPVTKKVWLNIEGQFLDSQAIAFSLNYSF